MRPLAFILPYRVGTGPGAGHGISRPEVMRHARRINLQPISCTLERNDIDEDHRHFENNLHGKNIIGVMHRSKCKLRIGIAAAIHVKVRSSDLRALHTESSATILYAAIVGANKY